MAEEGREIELRLDQIQLNPDQPRQTKNPSDITALAATINHVGLIHAVTVMKIEEGDGYMLVSGERRYLAHQELGRETIRAVVTTADPHELALVENVQREDLNPIDLAEALQKLQREYKFKQADLGRIIGKKAASVSELLSILGLPAEIKEEARGLDYINKSQLVELAKYNHEPLLQKAIWARIKKQGLPVQRIKEGIEEIEKSQLAVRSSKMVKQARSFTKRLDKLLTGVESDEQLPDLEEIANELAEQHKKLRAAIKRLSEGRTETEEVADEAAG